jgi:hypothetical protein
VVIYNIGYPAIRATPEETSKIFVICGGNNLYVGEGGTMNPFLIPPLVAVAITPSPPDAPPWFRQLPLEEGLIYGVGMGPDPSSAEGDARRQIALRLSSTVRAEVTGKHTELVTPFASDALDQKTSNYIVLTSISNLPAVAIVKREQVGATHYALAELNTTQAIKYLCDVQSRASAWLTKWIDTYKTTPIEARLAQTGPYLTALMDLQASARLLDLLNHFSTVKMPSSPESTYNVVLSAMECPPIRRVLIKTDSPNSAGGDALATALLSRGISLAGSTNVYEVVISWSETTKTATFYNVPTEMTTLTMRVSLRDGADLHLATTTLPFSTLQQGRRDFIAQNLQEWLGIPSTSGTDPAN